MKTFLKAVVLILCLFVFTEGYSLNGDEALRKFQDRMYGVGTMSGQISWVYTSGTMYSGSFKYMAPGRIYVKFTTPTGRVLVTNGKKLWVYDSQSNICGVQDLGRGGSGGIASLVQGYLPLLSAQGSGGYTIKLKSNERQYNEITLVLDGNFMMKKAVMQSRGGGEGLSITLSNVRTGEGMTAGTFDFNVPSNAQLVKNPLDVK
ncbi:MAG: outer membrane lipoprotein carrier protein LolA [Spirochaetes bacterium]|nr:MAG: outer membrane lipoprotein carrier protein LolA [Spirochaetota bacterium]